MALTGTLNIGELLKIAVTSRQAGERRVGALPHLQGFAAQWAGMPLKKTAHQHHGLQTE